MNIILFTTADGRPGSLNLSRPRIYLPLLGLVALVCSLLMYTGYRLGGTAAPAVAVVPTAAIPDLRADLAQQQHAVEQVRRRSQTELDALAVRVAQIQAQIMRIEGLGQRLVDLADLDRGEFNFGQAPAQGGPIEAVALERALERPAPTDFMQALDELSAQIKDRERQLIVLEDIFQGRGLSLQGHPAGSPVAEGWLSSFFGVRTDPFTGRPAMHEGLDFAGKFGSPVVAVAAGSVIWAGPRDGYGNLVEIDHGHGFVTRYGHNSRNLVRVGQLVRKGQQIARMGSSGRSTGPHVHFEVLREGQPVNPLRYLRASR
ncbi:MAG: peptidoglycan DD-metalloendopeptidase family protein [Gammaproteobacteria bacterium]|nr:peptidoglycan DD-metalloendopeptidase family protein [Gammaproteobacteria bacterium]